MAEFNQNNNMTGSPVPPQGKADIAIPGLKPNLSVPPVNPAVRPLPAASAKEAASRTFFSIGKLKTASPWLRFLAYLIDINIATGIGAGLFFVFFHFFLKTNSSLPVQKIVFFSGTALACIIGNWLYSALFESSFRQATLGMMICSCKVVNEDGSRITFSQASKRFFAKAIVFVSFGILFLPAFFGRSAFQDFFTGMPVVKK